MNSSYCKQLIALTLFAALAHPAQLAVQAQLLSVKKEQMRYKLIDLGTFGGPNSGNNSPSVLMNSAGAVTGWADTFTPDPYAPNCFGDCFVQHAFEWRNGVLIDLGPLPGGYSSYTNWINSREQIVGQSQNGLIDPLTDIPEFVAAVWQDGKAIDLGTFGGGFSLATANNNRQQVVGCAFNDTLDSFSPTGVFYGIGIGPQQLRAFRWQDKQLRDLGTLGGPDACAVWINDSGEIVGASFMNSIVNPASGLPTLAPFLWENGRMLDLGTLGGSVGLALMNNNRDQVIGQSSLAENPGACFTGEPGCHAFLWDRGTLRDLGTLGGTFSIPNWINDAGEVVGVANTAGDQQQHATLWKSGETTDLGTLPDDCDSRAFALNSKREIVGWSVSCDGTSTRAVVWEKGGPALDLNALVNPASGLQLTEPEFISDAGKIVVKGVLPNGDTRSVVLIPCDANDEGCVDIAAATTNAALRSSATILNHPVSVRDPQRNLTPRGIAAAWRAQMLRRYRVPTVAEPKG